VDIARDISGHTGQRPDISDTGWDRVARADARFLRADRLAPNSRDFNTEIKMNATKRSRPEDLANPKIQGYATLSSAGSRIFRCGF
jgi:hypothetical protein